MLKYGHEDMGKINVGEVTVDLMDVMKVNKIRMPHGLTLLARGLTHMEGVLAAIAPDINMAEIAAPVFREIFSVILTGKRIEKQRKKRSEIDAKGVGYPVDGV